jgi:hypothetical protein
LNEWIAIEGGSSLNKNRVLILAVAAAVLLSGCLFSIKGFRFSALRVRRGEKVIARLTLAPTARIVGADERGRVFILVHIPDTPDSPDLNVVRPKRFDIHDNFNGPRRLVKDEALEAQIFAHGNNCERYFGEFAENYDASEWDALTTERVVRTRDEFLKTAETRIGIKAPEGASHGAVVINFYAGAWTDDDEIEGPSPEDDIGCLTSVESTLAVGNGKVEL